MDGMVSEGNYSREKQYLEMELEILVVHGAEAAEEAGRLVEPSSVGTRSSGTRLLHVAAHGDGHAAFPKSGPFL